MSQVPPDMLDTIITGDCLEVMKQLPDGCVDAVITDPPYGIAKQRHRTGTDGNQSRSGATAKGNWYNRVDTWDLHRPSREVFDWLLRVSASQFIWGGNYFADILPPSSSWVVWNKDNTTTKFSHFEMAWTSRGGAARIVNWRWNGMLQEPGHPRDTRTHPTQKPLGLMLWVLKKYSIPSDIILDPFCGSGTTCVAAKRLGRRYIGIEIDPGYAQTARNRLRDTEKPLFQDSHG